MATTRSRMIALVACVLLFILFLLPAQIRPENFLPDDTYYYLQVAYNIIGGNGSTFNGITPTNGYHPLWMLFCMAGMAIAGGDKELAIHIVLAIQAILFLGIVVYVRRISRDLGFRLWPVALPVLAAYFLTGLYGSEAHLNGLASIATLYYLLRAHNDGASRDWALAGLCAGLALLARLDNIFFIAAIALLGIVVRTGAERRESIAKRIILFALPVAIVVAPYLIYNAIAFGHLMPISGAIKSSFPEIAFGVGRLALLGKIVAVGSIISIILSISFTRDRRAALLLRVLGAATLMQCVYITLFVVRGAGWSWYYVIGILNLAFTLVVIVDRIAARVDTGDRVVLQRLAGAFILLVTMAGLARGWYRLNDAYFTQRNSFFESVGEGRRNFRKDLALWMKANLPAGSAVVVEEGAGMLGYYSDLRILPLDGLIGDYTYNDDLLRLGASGYLRAHDVGYYLGVLPPHSEEVRKVNIVAPLYRRSAGILTLADSDIVTIRKDHPQRFDIAIWKIRGEL